LNDLKRLIEVIEHFQIPSGLVINKSDIHPGGIQAIKDFTQINTISVLSMVPYDIHVPKAIAEARPVVTAYPESVSCPVFRKHCCFV